MRGGLGWGGRNGVGTVFLIAVSVVVVLTIMMFANSIFTSRVRENTVDLSVAERAATVAESAVEEASYVLLKTLNDPMGKEDLYLKLRQFDPNKTTATGDETLFEPGMTATVEPRLTTRAYQDSTDTRAGPVTAGPYERLALSPSPDSNESYGTFGFKNITRVTPPGNYRSVDEEVFFAKAYKLVLLAPPIPFNRYTLFLRDSRRVRHYHERYQQAAAEVEKFNQTAPASQQVELPPFPLADPSSSRPVFSTTAALDGQELTVPALSATSTASPSGLAGALQSQFPRFAGALTRQSVSEATDFDNEHYWDQLTPESLRKHATHVFDNFAELVGLVSKNGVLHLNGYYYVKREVTLNQPWTGRGVIVSEASEGISVKSAPRQGQGGRLVLIASGGPIDLGGLSAGEPLEADLLAPNGVLQGASGKRIVGCVLVQDLDNTPDPFTPGPSISRPPDSDYEAWTAGEMPASYAKQLVFFLNPGFLKREYISRRERRSL